jgi:hypothetical protein
MKSLTSDQSLCIKYKFFYHHHLQEVEELFSGEGCPKYISCEPAHNNYWYIQFESEDGAQKVCMLSITCQNAKQNFDQHLLP